MGFLDRVNKAKAPAATETKRFNPLLAKKATAEAAAPTEEPAAAVPATAAPAAPAKKFNPLMAKLKKESKKEAAVEAAAPEKEEQTTEAPAVEPKKEKDLAAAINEEQVASDDKKETPAKATEETSEEPAAEPAAEPKKEEAVEPKKTSRKRATKKKAAAAAESEDEAAGSSRMVHATEYGTMDVLGNRMSYSDAATLVMNQFHDEGWEKYEAEVSEKIQSIKIEADMNPGTLKYVIEELNALSDEIAIPLDQATKLLEAMTDKDFGACTAYRTINSTSGGNAEDRKKSGFLALVNANVAGTNVNYIALIAATKMRYTFLKGISNRLKAKRDLLITMSSALKMENTGLSLAS